MASIGNLVAKISADTASLQQDMGRAVNVFGRGFAQMEARAKTFSRTVKGAFAAVIFNEVVQGVGRVIDSFDELNDLSKKFNAPVDQVAAFASIAKQTGTEIDALAKASQKLNVQLLDAGKAGSEAARLFAALKLDPKQLQAQGGVDAIISVVGALERIPNASERAAAAQKVFGKSAADLIPFLSEGSEKLRAMQQDFDGLRGNTSFAEMAKEADRFNDNIARLKVVFNAFVADLLGPVLKALNAVLERFLTARKLSSGFAETVRQTFSSDESVSQDIAIAKKNIKLHQEELADAEKNAFFARDAQLKNIKEKIAFEQANLDKALRVQADRAETAAIQKAVKPNTEFAKALTEDPKKTKTGSTRKAPSTFGSQRELLKDTEFFVAQERDILQQRGEALREVFERSRIGIQEYYATLESVQLEYLRNVQGYYDAEIAALQKYIAAKKTSPEDRARAQEKIGDLERRRADVTKDAAGQIVREHGKEIESLEELRRTVDSVAAEYEELIGNGKKAAAIRFDLQNEKLSQLLTANNESGALKELDALREATIAQAALNDAQSKSAGILEDLGRLEDGIQLAREKGVLSELEAMQQVSAARQKSIAALGQQAAEAQRAVQQAQNAGAPGIVELQRQADVLKLKYDEVRGSVNVLANDLERTSRGLFKDAFKDFIKGTQSAGEAFKSFVQGVADRILDLATDQVSNDLYKGIFGDPGQGGGLGNILASAFGGSGNLVANRPSVQRPAGATPPYVPDSGGGFLSAIASLFSGGRAVGGLVAPGRLYRVNEGSKAEAFMPLSAGRISQTTPGDGPRMLNITVNVPQGTSRSTADQTAATVGQAVNRALRRNN
jgi:hypothetical protein